MERSTSINAVKDICLNPKRLGLHYTAWVCHFLKTSIWNPATNNFPLEKCLTETSFALWLRINDQLGTNNSSRKSFNRISNITNTSVDMTKPKYWNNIHILLVYSVFHKYVAIIQALLYAYLSRVYVWEEQDNFLLVTRACDRCLGHT